jgi:hypothetical protein
VLGSAEDASRENIKRREEILTKMSAGEDITQSVLSPRGKFPSIEEQKQRDASAFKEAMREMLNPMQKIVDSQDRTTEAVKKIPGAVAK